MTAFRKLLIGTAGAMIALSGCKSSEANQVAEQEFFGTPLDRNPIEVQKTTEFLEIDLPSAQSRLTAIDRDRIRAFVIDYRDRGHGPLVMSMPQGGNAQLAVQAVAEAREIAWSLGVNYNEISGDAYQAQGDEAGGLLLAFEAYEAIAPDCGTLAQQDLGNARGNNGLPTLGCAVRSNIAAMLADPADLLGERPIEPGDLGRKELILENFRAGAPTAAQRSDDETGRTAVVGGG